MDEIKKYLTDGSCFAISRPPTFGELLAAIDQAHRRKNEAAFIAILASYVVIIDGKKQSPDDILGLSALDGLTIATEIHKFIPEDLLRGAMR